MNWLTVACVVCVAFVVWTLRTDYLIDHEWPIPVAICSVLLLLILALVALLNLWQFTPHMAELAQLRQAAVRLECSASEDVMGKAADWNMTIQSRKVWNGRLLADPFIPNGWDTVSVIDIPRCVER